MALKAVTAKCYSKPWQVNIKIIKKTTINQQ